MAMIRFWSPEEKTVPTTSMREGAFGDEEWACCSVARLDNGNRMEKT